MGGRVVGDAVQGVGVGVGAGVVVRSSVGSIPMSFIPAFTHLLTTTAPMVPTSTPTPLLTSAPASITSTPATP